MARNQISSTRVYQFVFGLMFLFASYGAVRGMMFGSTQNAKQIAFLAIAFAVVLWLDSLYWLILPLCMVLGIQVPGLPFNCTELGCLAFSGVHMVRTCLHRDRLVPWNRVILSAFPLVAWICAIWAMNPTGINLLRSFGVMETQSMGGRFYLKIVFSFVAMCCLSTVRLREWDCKQLYRVIIGGGILSIVMLFLHPEMAESGAETSGGVVSRYYLLAFSGLYSILWARYSIMDILSSLKLFLFLGVSALATIASGKRSVSASMALIPIYRALLTRSHRWLTVFIGLIAFGILCFAVSLDGVGSFAIPLSAKRSLAMIFPKYREKGFEGLHDTFRTEVHAYAKELIQKHPWVGRRGFRMDMDSATWLYGMGFAGPYAGHAFSGNWHGAFWSYAADFGIPCLLLYLLLVWNGLRFAFRYAPVFPVGSFQLACFLYYAMIFVHQAFIMFTSGHSSLTAEGAFLNLGMMAAVVNELQSRQE